MGQGVVLEGSGCFHRAPPRSSAGGTGLAVGCRARALGDSGRGSPSGTSRFLHAEVRQGGGCGGRRVLGGCGSLLRGGPVLAACLGAWKARSLLLGVDL